MTFRLHFCHFLSEKKTFRLHFCHFLSEKKAWIVLPRIHAKKILLITQPLLGYEHLAAKGFLLSAHQ